MWTVGSNNKCVEDECGVCACVHVCVCVGGFLL